jgi:hypothetical protein
VGAEEVREVVKEVSAFFGFEDFDVGDFYSDLVAQEEVVEEFFLKEVFSAFFVVVGPVAGEAVSDFKRVESCEEAIAGVLGGCGQNRVEEMLFGDIVVGGEEGF